MNKINKFINKVNDFIAAKSTIMMGTMWCVYAFTIWAILPLAFPGLQSVVFYVSGGIIQLIALPLIMVGQQVLSRDSEKRSIKDHQTIMIEFKEIKEIHELTLKAIQDNQNEIEQLKQLNKTDVELDKKINKIIKILNKKAS